MEINWLTVFATLINFAIVFLILRHFLYEPVNKTISSRESEIKETIEKTQQDQEAARNLRLENEQKLSSAKDEGRKIVEDFKKKAEQVSDSIIDQAKNESETLMDRARREVEREKEKAKEEIRNQAVDLAIILSTKALGETINEEQHRRLIKDFISKVGIQ